MFQRPTVDSAATATDHPSRTIVGGGPPTRRSTVTGPATTTIMESRPVPGDTTGPGLPTTAIVKRRSLTGCDTATNRAAATIRHRRTVALPANCCRRASRSIREPGPVPISSTACNRTPRSIRVGCSRRRFRPNTSLPPRRNCPLGRHSRQFQGDRTHDTKTHHFPHQFTPVTLLGTSIPRKSAYHVPGPEKPWNPEIAAFGVVVRPRLLSSDHRRLSS